MIPYTRQSFRSPQNRAISVRETSVEITPQGAIYQNEQPDNRESKVLPEKDQNLQGCSAKSDTLYLARVTGKHNNVRYLNDVRKIYMCIFKWDNLRIPKDSSSG